MRNWNKVEAIIFHIDSEGIVRAGAGSDSRISICDIDGELFRITFPGDWTDATTEEVTAAAKQAIYREGYSCTSTWENRKGHGFSSVPTATVKSWR